MFDGLPEREAKELCARWLNCEFGKTTKKPKFTQEEVKAYCKIKTEIDRINKEAEEG